jgi:hypothetical protein
MRKPDQRTVTNDAIRVALWQATSLADAKARIRKLLDAAGGPQPSDALLRDVIESTVGGDVIFPDMPAELLALREHVDRLPAEDL